MMIHKTPEEIVREAFPVASTMDNEAGKAFKVADGVIIQLTPLGAAVLVSREGGRPKIIPCSSAAVACDRTKIVLQERNGS